VEWNGFYSLSLSLLFFLTSHHSLTLLCYAFSFCFLHYFLISLGSTTATTLLNSQTMLLHRDRTQNHQVQIAKH